MTHMSWFQKRVIQPIENYNTDKDNGQQDNTTRIKRTLEEMLDLFLYIIQKPSLSGWTNFQNNS